MIGVTNASPIIYLGKISALFLLPELFTDIYTSKHVKEEVLKKEHAPERALLTEAFDNWIKIGDQGDETFVSRLMQMQIHRGEAEVIALARRLIAEKHEAIVIIDDLAARDIARVTGLEITGTIGILLRAKSQRLISNKDSKNYLDTLINDTNFRISIKEYNRIIKLIES